MPHIHINIYLNNVCICYVFNQLSEVQLKVPVDSTGRPVSPLNILPKIKSEVTRENVLHVPQPLTSPTHTLAHQHVLTVDMFTKDQLNELFNLAQTLRIFVLKERPIDHILKVILHNDF